MNNQPEPHPEETPILIPDEHERIDPPVAELNPLPDQTGKFKRKTNVVHIEKRAQAIFSILTKVTIALLVVAVLIFFVSEITSDGLVIQQISVPDAYVQAGYTGPVLAQRVINRLDDMIYKTATYDRSVAYTNAFDNTDVSIDMVGMGVPIRGAIEMIGETIGVQRKKKIKAAIVIADTSVIMDLNITGEHPVRFVVPNHSNPEIPLKQLIAAVSENILKMTNVRTLSLWYSNVERNAPKTIELAQFTLEKDEGDSIKEAEALTDWAGALSLEHRDTLALLKLKEALAKSKSLPSTYATWASILFRLGKYEESMEKDKKSLSLLGSDAPRTLVSGVLNNIATDYIMVKQFDSAMLYLNRSMVFNRYNADVPYNLACVCSLKGDTVGCFENLSKALSMGYNPGYVLSDPDLAPMLRAPAIKGLLAEYQLRP
jgi:tetratricopeptide (TPR) repeat protein